MSQALIQSEDLQRLAQSIVDESASASVVVERNGLFDAFAAMSPEIALMVPNHAKAAFVRVAACFAKALEAHPGGILIGAQMFQSVLASMAMVLNVQARVDSILGDRD